MSRVCITPIFACLFDLTHDEYQEFVEKLRTDGYRLTQVDGYPTSEGVRFAGLWIRDIESKLTASAHGKTSSEYQDYFDDLNERGYRIECVSGYLAESGSPKYASFFNDGSFHSMHSHHRMDTHEYQDKFEEYAALGYALTWINGYSNGQESRYAGIWSKHGNHDFKGRHNLPSADYQSTYLDLENQGYRIKVVSAHQAAGQTFFAGLWVRETGYDPAGRHNSSPEQFETQCREFAYQDFMPTCISGYQEGNKDRMAGVFVKLKRNWSVTGRGHDFLLPFDATIKDLMQQNQVPAGSLAITRNGNLILAKGYSLITEYEDTVYPTSLFRLASVSKSLTGAAIVKLVEEGKIALTDKLANLISLPGEVKDTRVFDITVNHLLHHVGGWDFHVTDLQPTSNDSAISRELGIPLPITQESIMKFMNAKKDQLQFDPGSGNEKWPTFDPVTKASEFPYSNYGYMLLGRIIEEVTGESYESFVQRTLLAPLGISRMRIARSLIGKTLPGEVLYHTGVPKFDPAAGPDFSNRFNFRVNVMAEGGPSNVMMQYGGQFNFANSAAGGGWVASAVDLVRFVSELDDPNTCAILKKSSVNELFRQYLEFGDCGKNQHYGCGWYVTRGANEEMNGGTMEGTKTTIIRWRDKGASFTAALLFNKFDDNLIWDGKTRILNTAKSISLWPSVNFWEDYF